MLLKSTICFSIVEKSAFSRKTFSLAIVDGCHRGACIQKLGTSVQPGTECAFQPIRMTLIRASESAARTKHEHVKLSSFTKILSEHFLQDTSVTAVINSLVQYSETFESTYGAFFQEARATNAAKNPSSCGLIYDTVESVYRRYVRARKLKRRSFEAL